MIRAITYSIKEAIVLSSISSYNSVYSGSTHNDQVSQPQGSYNLDYLAFVY